MQQGSWKKAVVKPRSCGASKRFIAREVFHTLLCRPPVSTLADSSFRKFGAPTTGHICILKELMGAVVIKIRPLKRHEKAFGHGLTIYTSIRGESPSLPLQCISQSATSSINKNTVNESTVRPSHQSHCPARIQEVPIQHRQNID